MTKSRRKPVERLLQATIINRIGDVEHLIEKMYSKVAYMVKVMRKYEEDSLNGNL